MLLADKHGTILELYLVAILSAFSPERMHCECVCEYTKSSTLLFNFNNGFTQIQNSVMFTHPVVVLNTMIFFLAWTTNETLCRM